ncbi:MAG: rod shape-determining protein MreC [Christensenellales bacterium]
MKKPARKTSAKKKRLRDQSSGERQRTILRLGGYGLVTILLLVIVMMIASTFFPTIGALDAPRKLVTRFITPIQDTFADATDAVVSYLRTLKLQSNLQYEYEQLRIKYDEAVDRGMLADEYKRQLQVQADANDEIQRNYNLDGIKANVIGGDTTNYTLSLTIDVGTDQGVENNMAVVQPGALVGYTYNVGKDRANVRCIVDSTSSIHALIESSRDQGQIKGTLAIDGEYACRMYYLEYTSLPRPGDLVVTSGVGMEFPKGIPIGLVRESTRGLQDNKQYIVVEPLADFNHMETVIVYRYRPSFAQPADARGSEISASFQPLPSLVPVPTLIGQKEPELTPGPDGLIPGTPSPTPTASPTPAPSRSPLPSAAQPDDGFTYNAKPLLAGTSTPEPSPEPSPTPQPSPTFSVDQMTVEKDD